MSWTALLHAAHIEFLHQSKIKNLFIACTNPAISFEMTSISVLKFTARSRKQKVLLKELSMADNMPVTFALQ